MECPVCHKSIDLLYLEDCVSQNEDAVCDNCKSVLDIGIDWRYTGEDEIMFIYELTLKV